MTPKKKTFTGSSSDHKFVNWLAAKGRRRAGERQRGNSVTSRGLASGGFVLPCCGVAYIKWLRALTAT